MYNTATAGPFNSISFSPEEVEAGLLAQQINTMLDFNKNSQDFSYDIHLWTDGYSTVLDFVQTPNDGSYGGGFAFIDEDQEILSRVRYPDGSSELCYPDEVEEKKADWKAAHPEEEYKDGIPF